MDDFSNYVCPRGIGPPIFVLGGLERKFVLGWLQCNHLSVPGSLQAKSVCPRGALQAELSVPGGSQEKSVCPGIEQRI